jgi:uncharacterized YigZ family protein
VSSGYPVPARAAHAEIVVARSRFVSVLERADSVGAAREAVARARQLHPQATHHVYAFVIGHGKTVTHGMSDDGEPSGTAGPPTLAVLRGADVGNAVLVTARYFGGTKLGTGGLVRAYSDAARAVLRAAELEPMVQRTQARLEVAYAAHDAVLAIGRMHDVMVVSVSFGEAVLLTLAIPRRNVAAFADAVADATSGAASLTLLE